MTWLALPLTREPPPQPSLPDGMALELEPASRAAALAAELYRTVGVSQHWQDRLAWNNADWMRAINRPDIELWTLHNHESLAGYFELRRYRYRVDIRYFGLVPAFIGRGLGRLLLECAIARAAALGARRVTVNTCTLDHPAALPNYIARGFLPTRRTMRQQVVAG